MGLHEARDCTCVLKPDVMTQFRWSIKVLHTEKEILSIFISHKFVLKCYCDQNSILFFLCIFQNYVTEPVRDRSLKPSFQEGICLFLLKFSLLMFRHYKL